MRQASCLPLQALLTLLAPALCPLSQAVFFKMRVAGVLHIFQFETKQGEDICMALQVRGSLGSGSMAVVSGWLAGLGWIGLCQDAHHPTH